jgi:hypothetical protein
MKIIIESGIPFQPEIKPSLAPQRYPFDRMKVGDSFRVPESLATSARVLASRRSRQGEVYRSRAEGDGIRIWRLA